MTFNTKEELEEHKKEHM
ncbi:MAG: hypothetical protein GTN80_07285 [Nitrososphaeria archaeon]|nr:hypothetical protein [Nitrososphaeria archaeon]NIQ33428.1 hypothetical protein [Nitrososphaeria archaeon]